MGIIVSTFTGIGREELISSYDGKIKILDQTDQSILDEVPPDSYVSGIMSQVDDYDIVFIPTDKHIRDEFERRNIDYDIFYPSKERRQEIILKLVGGRMPFPDIAKFDNSCNKLIDEIDNDESPNCYKHKLSENNQFIWNDQTINNYINSVIENAKHSERVEESTRSEENNETHEEGNA